MVGLQHCVHFSNVLFGLTDALMSHSLLLFYTLSTIAPSQTFIAVNSWQQWVHFNDSFASFKQKSNQFFCWNTRTYYSQHVDWLSIDTQRNQCEQCIDMPHTTLLCLLTYQVNWYLVGSIKECQSTDCSLDICWSALIAYTSFLTYFRIEFINLCKKTYVTYVLQIILLNLKITVLRGI